MNTVKPAIVWTLRNNTGKLIPGSSCLAAYLINLTCSFDLLMSACTELTT